MLSWSSSSIPRWSLGRLLTFLLSGCPVLPGFAPTWFSLLTFLDYLSIPMAPVVSKCMYMVSHMIRISWPYLFSEWCGWANHQYQAHLQHLASHVPPHSHPQG